MQRKWNNCSYFRTKGEMKKEIRKDVEELFDKVVPNSLKTKFEIARKVSQSRFKEAQRKRYKENPEPFKIRTKRYIIKKKLRSSVSNTKQ